MLLLPVLLNLQCTDPRTVTTLIRLATSVVHLVETFSKDSDLFSKRVAEVSGVATSSLNANEEVTKVAKFWENQWQDIHSRYDNLKSVLQEIGVKTAEYFQEMESNNAQINNVELKKKDAERTAVLRTRWEQEYQSAATSLANTEPVLRDGDDFMYLLRNEVLRSTVTDAIPSLGQISKQAEMLSVNIKSFEKSAKTIFTI